jgi:transposase
MEVLYPRCCGLDVHRETVVACVRVQDHRRKRTEVRSFGTTTSALLELHRWLSEEGCTHVAMESRGSSGSPYSTCWKAASS